MASGRLVDQLELDRKFQRQGRPPAEPRRAVAKGDERWPIGAGGAVDVDGAGHTRNRLLYRREPVGDGSRAGSSGHRD